MTTNEIQVFSNSQFGDIRTIIAKDGEPRFCLADLCKAINVTNHRNVAKRIDPDGVRRVDIPTQGGTQQVLFVTEAGMYEVLLRSDSEEAKPFRKWVTSEVLPSIRKTGGYIATKHDDTPEEIMARALVVAQSTLERQQKRLQEQTMTIERAGTADTGAAQRTASRRAESVLLRRDADVHQHADDDAGRQRHRVERLCADRQAAESGYHLPAERTDTAPRAVLPVGTAQDAHQHLHPLQRRDRHQHLHGVDAERAALHQRTASPRLQRHGDGGRPPQGKGGCSGSSKGTCRRRVIRDGAVRAVPWLTCTSKKL